MAYRDKPVPDDFYTTGGPADIAVEEIVEVSLIEELPKLSGDEISNVDVGSRDLGKKFLPAVDNEEDVFSVTARDQVAVSPSGIGFELRRKKHWRRQDPDREVFRELVVLCRLDATRIPSISESEDSRIIRHEVDLELAETHAADHRLVSGLHETPVSKLFLELCPGRKARQVNDKVDVICGTHILERDQIGDEERGRTSADED